MGTLLRHKQEIYGGKHSLGIEQVLAQWFSILGYSVESPGELKKIAMPKPNSRSILPGICSSFSILVLPIFPDPTQTTCMVRVCHCLTNTVISFSSDLICNSNLSMQAPTHCSITAYLISDFFLVNIFQYEFEFLKRQKIKFFQVPIDLPTFYIGTQKY